MPGLLVSLLVKDDALRRGKPSNRAMKMENIIKSEKKLELKLIVEGDSLEVDQVILEFK